MDTIIWIIVVGLPVAMLIYLFGWLVGFNTSSQMTNWGTGYDDGWKAHKKLSEEIMRVKQTAVKVAEKYSVNKGTTIGKHSETAEIIADEIKNLPSVDTVPVVHGKWIITNGMKPPKYHHHHQCSVCGAYAPMRPPYGSRNY